ncbi:MAG: hypothetical protein JW910_07035, partial [Anaerolineae bacterium]|nr:hypothetical protein [Anaerolineae bacterium]
MLAKRLLGAAILALALAAQIVPAQAQGATRLVPPSGPFQVGRTAYQWVDEARAEVHTDDPDDRRALLVEVWYPAEPAINALYAPYYDAPLADLFTEMYQVPGTNLHAVRSNAFAGAPVSGAQPVYPVILFDPGFSAAPRQYTILIEELASYGYVVFALSHPYVTTLTVFPDGGLIEPLNYDRLASLWAPQDIYQSEFEQVWVPDGLFALRQIEALNADDPQGLFAGRLDLDRLGVIG